MGLDFIEQLDLQAHPEARDVVVSTLAGVRALMPEEERDAVKMEQTVRNRTRALVRAAQTDPPQPHSVCEAGLIKIALKHNASRGLLDDMIAWAKEDPGSHTPTLPSHLEITRDTHLRPLIDLHHQQPGLPLVRQFKSIEL